LIGQKERILLKKWYQERFENIWCYNLNEYLLAWIIFIFNLYKKSKIMKYLTAKLLAASLLVCGAFSQSTINPSDPTWGWDDFK
jgi:hypothetical protein